MEMQYFKDYSPALGRDMECKIYGHAGRPMLYIPCQDGRFFDFEDFHMADTLAPWIESGQIMVLSIDTLDKETWSDTNGDPYWRIRRYEQWLHYIVDEAVPKIRCLSQDIRHVIHDLFIPPVPVVLDVVAPQVHPHGDALGLEDALEVPGGVRLLPGALTAADDRLLVPVQLHIGVVGGEVPHIVHGRVLVHQLVHVAAKAIVGGVDAAERQTTAEDVRSA